jgi:HJR/Mrr/RecB family endonuclease
MQAAAIPSTPELAECIRFAQQHVAQLKAECVQSGALLVDHETEERAACAAKDSKRDVALAKRNLRGSRVRLFVAYSHKNWCKAHSFIHQFAVKYGLPDFVVALIGGTAFLLALLLVAASCGIASGLAIGGGCIAFATGFIIAFRFATAEPNNCAAENYLAALREIEHRRRLFEQAGEIQKRAIAHRETIDSLLPLKKKYEEELQKLVSFIQELNDRRNKLLLEDWRAMRGIPFEDFLKEVLQVLGFTVDSTKATGDQGIDLVASRAGERLGVQVKGYDGSVSNRAVQEAFAGMSHYRCHRCAVVTNSEFTSAARELALSTGCILVDKNLIPELIAGNVFAPLELSKVPA